MSGPGRWRSPRYYEPANIDVPTAGGCVFLQAVTGKTGGTAHAPADLPAPRCRGALPLVS